MAGTLNVDTLKADSNLKLQIASANVAFIDASGLNLVGSNLRFGGVTVQSSQFNANGTILAAGIASVNASTATSGTLPTARLPAGTVLQVAQATFTGTQTIAPGGVNMNWTDITNLSVTITPTSASSKFILMAQVSCAAAPDRLIALRFTGGNAGNFVGDSAGSRTRVGTYLTSPSGIDYGITTSLIMNYLDSPATASAITYKVQAAPNFSSGNVLINLNIGSDSDQAYIPRSACSLIVMEIAA